MWGHKSNTKSLLSSLNILELEMLGLEPSYPYGISSNTCFGSVWGASSGLSLPHSRQLSEQQQQFDYIHATAV